MTDLYAGSGDDLLSPSKHATAVTPSDSAPLTYASKRLWVGGAGNVTVIMVDGKTVTYSSVPAGTYLQIRVNQVNQTGTTATNIVAEY